MNLYSYDEDGQKSLLVVENVTPVQYCNDGFYHICDECNADYYVNEDGTLFFDENGQKKWKVKDIGKNECFFEIIEAV